MTFILRQIAPEGNRLRVSLQPDKETVMGRQPSVGQSSTVDVELSSQLIASQHVRLTVNADESECWVTDLGSEYGTRINGNRLEPWIRTQLAVGAELTLGFDYTFVLEKSNQPVRSYNEITSVAEDERLPISSSLAEQYVPMPYTRQSQPYSGKVPPGLAHYSIKLINFLPEIYRPSGNDGVHAFYQNGSSTSPNSFTSSRSLNQELLESNADFISRLLALIESVLLPIEWTANNFDLFLQVHTAPTEFLSWLEQWFMLLTDESWTEEQRRTFIAEADWLFARRGTKKALIRILEIYTGALSQIVEMDDSQLIDKMSPYEFHVQLQVAPTHTQVNSEVVRKIVDTFKPAHTTYKLNRS